MFKLILKASRKKRGFGKTSAKNLIDNAFKKM